MLKSVIALSCNPVSELLQPVDWSRHVNFGMETNVKGRFSEGQIIGISRETGTHGAVIRNICRKHNITELVGDSLAEAVRFELTVELPLRQFSRLLP